MVSSQRVNGTPPGPWRGSATANASSQPRSRYQANRSSSEARGAWVVVSCRERADAFAFSVSDGGVGIPEAHLHRILQMFHVVDPAAHTTGVGLAIVRKIVEMHGGAVAVESVAGRGATFRFSIPKRAG